jgi:ribonucleotide monophosphatase NagD (HAD superfamily)
VTAAVTGKPSPDFFEQCTALLGVTGREVAMVGDDLENDVLAAADAGLTGVLVRTGKFRLEAVDGAATGVDHVLDSIGDLPRLLG